MMALSECNVGPACSFRTFMSRHCSNDICPSSWWGKAVNFARELTRKSRLFEGHLHGYPRIGASLIAG
jgi:hypothetical protein